MPARVKSLAEYLDELEKTRKDKPEEVKEALEIYLDLWKRAIAKGIVMPADEIEKALAKVEESGGLYKAAED
jgi:hypothetical protein